MRPGDVKGMNCEPSYQKTVFILPSKKLSQQKNQVGGDRGWRLSSFPSQCWISFFPGTGKKALPPHILHLTMASDGCTGENIHGNTPNAPHPLPACIPGASQPTLETHFFLLPPGTSSNGWEHPLVEKGSGFWQVGGGSDIIIIIKEK